MAFEHKNNTGSLFKNDRKTEDTHADYNGTIIVDGVSYWLNGWLKQSAKGKFFSLSVKPKAAPTGASKPATAGTSNSDEMAFDVPF